MKRQLASAALGVTMVFTALGLMTTALSAIRPATAREAERAAAPYGCDADSAEDVVIMSGTVALETTLHQGTAAIGHGVGHATAEEHSATSTAVHAGTAVIGLDEGHGVGHTAVYAGTAVIEPGEEHGASVERPAAPHCIR